MRSLVAGFLNLGIVLLLAAGLVVAVRRLDRENPDDRSGMADPWSTIGSRWSEFRHRSAQLADRLIHSGAHSRR